MTKLLAVTVIDFETLPIEDRPAYPPKPVGFSIQGPRDKAPRYYAWGHLTGGNNCTLKQARNVLQAAWRSGPLLFHNAKFDIDVAQTHMDCKGYPEFHDTMFLLFLDDPHAASLALKQSAERLLGMVPGERDKMSDWLWDHRAEVMTDFGVRVSKTKAAMHTAYAPGDVAGEYADGDVTRTRKLFKLLYPRIASLGMLEAYRRELKLLPILLENERVGMRVDLSRLAMDIPAFEANVNLCDNWLRRRLKSPSLSMENDVDLASALSKSGMVADSAWVLTATGQRSVSKPNLPVRSIKDPKVASALGYRNRLQTCLKMFMQPWLEQASARPTPYISTNWNQTRNPSGGGTRTGRPSTSNPNFLNLSKSWHDKNDGYTHPKHLKLTPLPLVRSYILPDKGEVFCHRDFDGQELRVLAHFEGGPLMQAYQKNPHLDPHDYVRRMIEDVAGLKYERTPVKTINFQRLYGGGVPATMAALNISREAAERLLAAHGQALPGYKVLDAQLKSLGAQPHATWGERLYHVELPKVVKGRVRNFDYKRLNYLVQGSAADLTKEALIRWDNHPKKDARFLVTVYDEVNFSAAKRAVKEQMAVLRECMEGLELDVPMLTSGKTGPDWGHLTKFKESVYGG